MKLKIIFTMFILTMMCGCSNSSSSKLQSLVSKYIKESTKYPISYHSIYFSQTDTTNDELYKDSSMMEFRPDYKYSLTHVYEIENSDKEKVKMIVSFHFDSTLKIIGSSPKGLNGDYGQLTGNVFWKYNNFIGNKPDAGSEATLYSLDTLRNDLKYQITSDVMGNFKFDKVLPGNYLLIVNSRNTTNSPDDQIDMLLIYNAYISRIFGYNIYKENGTLISQYRTFDSLYYKALVSDDKESEGYNERYNSYKKIEKQKISIAESIIEKMPKSFTSRIGLYSAYSKKIKLSTVKIDEGKTSSEIIDFGITYF
jgi:hypothetical protein